MKGRKREKMKGKKKVLLPFIEVLCKLFKRMILFKKLGCTMIYIKVSGSNVFVSICGAHSKFFLKSIKILTVLNIFILLYGWQ